MTSTVQNSDFSNVQWSDTVQYSIHENNFLTGKTCNTAYKVLIRYFHVVFLSKYVDFDGSFFSVQHRKKQAYTKAGRLKNIPEISIYGPARNQLKGSIGGAG